MSSFRDASAIITGGGSGIGKALGSVLVEQGAHVVLADVDGEAVERAVSEVGGSGSGTAVAAVLDVRDADAVRTVVDDTAARHGHLDLLFNNAGISLGGPPTRCPRPTGSGSSTSTSAVW